MSDLEKEEIAGFVDTVGVLREALAFLDQDLEVRVCHSGAGCPIAFMEIETGTDGKRVLWMGDK